MVETNLTRRPIKVSDNNDANLTRYIRLVRLETTWQKFDDCSLVLTVELLNKDFQVLEAVKYTNLDLEKYGMKNTLLKYLTSAEQKRIYHALKLMKL